AHRLAGGLQMPHRLRHYLQAVDRITATDRERGHHGRDAVSERPVFVRGADADRHHRPELYTRGRVAAAAEAAPEPARDRRDDGVIDGPAGEVLDPLEIVQIRAHPAEAAVRADRAVDRGARST